MAFVELQRDFVPLKKDQPASLDVGSAWGRRLGGWLTWPELLSRRRVVLLAEAASGKTEEFRHQQAALAADGKPAFFLRIEELAEKGFASALGLEEFNAFEEWQNGTGTGWFFLDSIDEARLVHKSFSTALKQFGRELKGDLDRANIFVSCRITDWKGAEDYEAFNRILPVREKPTAPSAAATPVDSLLDPIFTEKSKSVPAKKEDKSSTNETTVLQLAPLSPEQYRTLAQSVGIIDIDAFVAAISRHGLEAFTERPGDLLALAAYWQDNRRFGSFREMVEHGVNRKLVEIDPHRADGDVLSATSAREGAEQIAAALTFAKTFAIKAPGHDPDPSLAAGALDAGAVLPDWTEGQINTLLRRGIFAPATYGRVRFHHRSTQEYLTAEWLHRLLAENCPLDEISQILFAERYGIKTVVPSLRPIAAWLAHHHPEIRSEIMRREPAVLMRFGDSGSLPMPVKEELLEAYAARHASAEVVGDRWDGRSLWMFADRGLAPTIARVWKANQKDDFRAELLRLIRDGAIKECVGLASKVALDKTIDWHWRILALEAVEACDEQKTLAGAARQISKTPGATDARLAASFASRLYPKHLTTSALIRLIRDTQPPPRGSIAGFGHAIGRLCEAAPNATERIALIAGIANLCLTPPFVDDHRRISKQFRFLAKQMHGIAATELKRSHVQVTPWLVRLLMVTERVEPPASLEKTESLHDLLRPYRELARSLFWADVEEQRRHAPHGERLIRYWQVYPVGVGRTLWEPSHDDYDWLFAQMRERTALADRRILLSAIVTVSPPEERSTLADQLQSVIRGSNELLSDLESYLAAPKEDPEIARYRKKHEARAQQEKAYEAKAKTSWTNFAAEVSADPSLLCESRYLRSWKAGAFRLKHLLHWLQRRTQIEDEKALRAWPLLEEGFGQPVAEAFRDGLTQLWRLIQAKRPVHTSGNGITTSWISILAFGAIGVEAAEDMEWISKLSANEARRAAQHGCLTEQGYPDWIDQLAVAFPKEVVPVIRQALEHEWAMDVLSVSSFLQRYASSSTAIPMALEEPLIAIVLKGEAGLLHTLELGLMILGKLTLTDAQRAALGKEARARLNGHRRAKRNDFALRYLAMLFLLEPDHALTTLRRWIEKGSGPQKDRAEELFGDLFERHDSLISGAIGRFSTSMLDQLLQLVYRHIRMTDDEVHEGSYTPGRRDRAENARNTILAALMARPGVDTYDAIRRAADNPDFHIRADRFRQLARQKAEQDTELQTWLPAEIVGLRTRHTAPVKTGLDLFRVVTGVLSDIKFRLTHGDFTSRPLLERAEDEDQVQNWLVEQINFQAKGRYHAFREAEVSGGDMPDVIVASTASPEQVAIETKHGGKGWTIRDLENSVRRQLAVDYLKPATRRHGVFVITNHRDRFWIDRKNGNRLGFDQLVERLAGVAAEITHNGFGQVLVTVVGLDAYRPKLDLRQEATLRISVLAERRRGPKRQPREKASKKSAV